MEVIRLDNVSLARRTQEEFSYDLKKTLLSILEGKYRKPVKRQVLNQINLVVTEGEKVGIVGANGSGKSTLLKVICSILKPTTGQVRVRGKIAPLIELGAGFDPEISILDNIILYGVLLGCSEREMRRRTPEILDFAELEDYATVPVKALSSGMVARLGFAIATDVQPDILILDEVLSVGDESFRNKCKRRIDRFWQANATILLVSHDLHFLQASCERVIWLDQGKVRMIGDAIDVVQAYAESARVIPDDELERSSDLNNLASEKAIEENSDEAIEIFPDAEPPIEEIPIEEPVPTGELFIEIPETPIVWATHIFIADQENKIVDTVNFGDSFYIGLEYEVFQSLQSLQIGLYLTDDSDKILLEPASVNWLATIGQINSIGKHKIYINIPAPLLKPGTYYIGGIGLHEKDKETQVIRTHQWLIKRLLSFVVTQAGSYIDEWFGQEVVHPILEWHIE